MQPAWTVSETGSEKGKLCSLCKKLGASLSLFSYAYAKLEMHVIESRCTATKGHDAVCGVVHAAAEGH